MGKAELVLLLQAVVRCTISRRDEMFMEQVWELVQATRKHCVVGRTRGGIVPRAPLRVVEEERRLAASGRFAGQVSAVTPASIPVGAGEAAGYEARRDFIRKRRKVCVPD